MSRLLRTATPLAAVAVFVAAGAGSAQAKVVDCDTYADAPNTKISSARGMSCAAAVKVMKSYRGEISKTFKVQAFRCRQVSGSQFGGQWRCTASRGRAFRFEFAD